MAATVDTSDLVTAKTISVRLGLSWPSRVHELVERQTEPMPCHVLAQPRVHLWRWSEVREWAADQDRYKIAEPGEWVTRQLILVRLDVDVDDVDVTSRPGPDGRVEWSWADAERVWIARQMNVHGGN